jgi:hypothetical protein
MDNITLIGNIVTLSYFIIIFSFHIVTNIYFNVYKIEFLNDIVET